MFFFLFSHVSSDTKYYTVVDCGSSGSRVYIYSYDDNEEWPKITYINDKTYDIKLADGATNGTKIVELVGLVNKYSKKKIPKGLLKSTKILLYATAGMRLLTTEQQKQVIKKTVSEIKKQTDLETSKNCVRVISGTEEATFMWLAYNHIMNEFNSTKTVGAIDMGGASLQISMEINKSEHKNNSDNYRLLSMKNHEYELFSYSFLGFGINKFNDAVKDLLINETTGDVIYSPCFFAGHNETYNGKQFYGETDFDKCNELIKKVYVPTVKSIKLPKYKEGTEEFFGNGCFASFPKIANISQNLTLPEIKKGAEFVCNMTYEESKAADEKYANTSCLMSVFIYGILKYGYEFDDSYKFVFVKKLDALKVSWTMGALIDDLHDLRVVESSEESHAVIYVVIGVCSAAILLTISALIVFLLRKKRPEHFDDLL